MTEHEIPELRPEDMDRFVAGQFPHERSQTDSEKAVEKYRLDLIRQVTVLLDEVEEAAQSPEYIHARRDFDAQAVAYSNVLNLLGDDG